MTPRSAVTVTLADGATAASSSEAVTVEGDVVTITAPGTYVLTGTLTDGQLVVNSDAEGKVRIVLADASISSSTTSPFVVTAADEAVLVLPGRHDEHPVSDGSSYGDRQRHRRPQRSALLDGRPDHHRHRCACR